MNMRIGITIKMAMSAKRAMSAIEFSGTGAVFDSGCGDDELNNRIARIVAPHYTKLRTQKQIVKMIYDFSSILTSCSCTMSHMWYIVGLGNPGEQYEQTRHNVGFMVCHAWLQKNSLPSCVPAARYAGLVSTGTVAEQSVTVLLPTTYMNHAGSAVATLVPSSSVNQLIVVYDDIDVPFGEVRIAFDRGTGGHNGLASIVSALGTTAFVRVRIGIAPRSIVGGEMKRPRGGGPLERFVLRPFGLLERRRLAAVLESAGTAITTIITKGTVAAMNTYNERSATR
jgi:PTH1 family peptidyl-tRNA hydrolase